MCHITMSEPINRSRRDYINHTDHGLEARSRLDWKIMIHAPHYYVWAYKQKCIVRTISATEVGWDCALKCCKDFPFAYQHVFFPLDGLCARHAHILDKHSSHTLALYDPHHIPYLRLSAIHNAWGIDFTDPHALSTTKPNVCVAVMWEILGIVIAITLKSGSRVNGTSHLVCPLTK